MKDYIATIVKNEPIADNVYAITFDLGQPAKVRCGQFGNISVGGTHLLRRPIAICKTEGNTVTFCYQIKGEGTQRLKTLCAGEKLNVLMPLGNGFYVEETEKKVALVGGGVGVFPLISVLRQYGAEKEISAYIGYRNKDAVCGVEEFQKATRFVAVTDDGSYGEKMNAVQAFEADLAKGNLPDVVLACGPTPMLRALKAVVERENLNCFVSD
jgi:dihydroorotate dehydrogenase electron transfer subunit